jgi:hypothetical protein
VKRAVASGWIERNHRKMPAESKALAEAEAPLPAGS